MKKYILTLMFFSLFVSLRCNGQITPSTFKQNESISVNKNNVETQICYGPSITSRGMHNTDCVLCNSDHLPHECFDGWCFGKYTVTVSAPSGWSFTGKPFLHCVQDNQGSCAWNGGYSNRMVITQSTPNFIEATVYIGSRAITVNLGCEATRTSENLRTENISGEEMKSSIEFDGTGPAPFLCGECGKIIANCNGNQVGKTCVWCHDPTGNNCKCPHCGKDHYLIQHTHNAF